MEYEIFEPEEDEYYDQACAAMYDRMFNEGRKYSVAEDPDSFICRDWNC